MRVVSTVFVGLTVVGAILVCILTVAGVFIPVPLRVIALAATAISMLLCMNAIANRGTQ